MYFFLKDSRLDDQRAVLIPIHNHNTSTTRPMSATTDSPSKNSCLQPTSKTLPDEDFFSLLNRLQSRRIDQQRTCLPTTINNTNSSLTSPTSTSTPSKRTRVKQ